MKKVTITSESLKKTFNRKIIIHNVSFTLNEGRSLAITGKNGSGKSTLVKILCGVLSPTSGRVRYHFDGKETGADELFRHIGLVSPYLNVYEEFTAEENLQFIAQIRGIGYRKESAERLLADFSIYDHRKKEVKNYSSGMKQRLKYCAALLHEPSLLIIDEPSSNLDEYGIAAVRNVMNEQKKRGALLFATNEKEDLPFADALLDIDALNAER